MMSRSPSELPTALQDVLRARPDTLFICGGDGTLRQTLTRLLVTYGATQLPRIAILRGGTMNTVATSVGIFRPPLPHLKVLLDRYDQSLSFSIARRHLLKVNQHYGFIFAIGGFANFIEYYQSQKNPSQLIAIKLLSQTIGSAMVGGEFSKSMFKKFPIHLWQDNKLLIQGSQVTTVSAATIRNIGFGFKPYYGAEDPDGRFGLLILKEPPRNLVFHLFQMYRGELIYDPTLLQLPSREVLVKTSTPMRPMLDGDILQAHKEFSISVGPSLDLIVG